jgi:SAM-dependent methyltransferase
MAFLNPVSHRRLQPEVMDQPGLEEQGHRHALRGLARINWWSGSVRILWPSLAVLARKQGSVRVLDLATGGGDVPVRLWQRARRAGLPLHIDGCDVSPIALDHARQRAATARADVRFFVADALADLLPTGYDVLMCSLFLHHLDEGQAVEFLRRMAAAAGRLVLVNDLVRSRTGLLLAYLGTRLLTRSPVVHTDGVRSVQGAFTIPEVRDLAARAGLAGATVEPRWPCRFLLTWSRP